MGNKVNKKRIFAFLLIVIVFAGTFAVTTLPIMKNQRLGLDLQGGFEVLYEVKPAKAGDKIDNAAMKATAGALDRRVNALGVNEPSIAIEGNNRIRVQIAGVSDQEEARKVLSTEANLTFRDNEDKVWLDGNDLKEGGASVDFSQQSNSPVISLKLKDGDKFGEVTRAIAARGEGNNQLIIWLDFEEGKDSYQAERAKANPKYISDPAVRTEINADSAVIEGNFTTKEANELASILNAGALPTKLTEVYSTSVGAQFGEDALNSTMIAGLIAFLAVFAFMIIFYRLPGFIASLALTGYCYFMLLVYDWMNAVLTLPGIAALILGVGIAVDANIISDERVRDELRKGRSLQAAFKEGNKHSLSTIIDAQATNLLVGIVLFIYGTSAVKGFATMLVVSLFIGFITAVYGTRMLMSLLVKSHFFDNRLGWFGVKKAEIKQLNEVEDDMKIPTKFDRFDFVKPRKIFFTVSTILLLIGIVALPTMGLNTSIDFSSGSRIQVTADRALTKSEVEKEFKRLDIKPEDTILAGEGNKSAVVRVKGELSKTEISKVKSEFKKLYGNEPNISTVSPTIGKELAKNAIIAVLISSIGIILYVTIRFEWQMAIAAIVSLLHDAFFIVLIFCLFRIEVDLTFIAAVLTILGYSINDTIVTFDRVRENMKKMKRLKTEDDIAFVANVSLRQTLGRSINTIIVVFLTVLAMLFFGSESIFNFNFALTMGLISGTYSSIWIALPLWVVFKNAELKKRGEIKTTKGKRRNLEGTV